MTQPRPFQTLKPPPIESLAVAYLTPLVAPLRVLTRLPPNKPGSDTPTTNTFIRVESGSGATYADGIMFDCITILQSYAPYDDEVIAEDNIGDALAWMSNAQGTTITDSTGYDWYVTFSGATSLPHRNTGPAVPLSCYRAAVMWRIPGKILS